MKTRTLLIAFGLFLIVGIPRLFTLDAHWSSDESRWLQRSSQFMQAVQTGQFEQTLQVYHPGVTTMWLAGIRRLFGNNETWRSQKDLALSRWFICVMVSAGLVAVFYLLLRLFEETWHAATAWGFVVLNPFFLAETRKVHTDALATIFILLTVLLFLLYCVTLTRSEKRHQKQHYLVCAGIVFGLACISKSHSLILLPWVPICLWLFCRSNTPWHSFLYETFITIILLLSYSVLTVFLVWPLFWHPFGLLLSVCIFATTLFLQHAVRTDRHVNHYIGTATLVLIICISYAAKTFWLVLDRVGWALTTPHNVDKFFLGKIAEDPGWLFYIFILSMKSTPFVLPFAVGTIFFLWRHRHDQQFSQLFKIAIAIVTFAILFTVCLTLTSKKISRYLLPVFPMLNLLAGIGLCYMIKWIKARLKNQHFQKVAHVTCIALVIFFTAVPIFSLHPYYGVYYNLCWRFVEIPKIMSISEPAGLELAAKYLNQKENADEIRVQASTMGAQFLRPYFIGRVYKTPSPKFVNNPPPPPPVDYEVVYILDSQIDWIPQEGARGGELEHVITLNGIDLVWIYHIQQQEVQ